MRLAIALVSICAATVARAQPSLTPPTLEPPPPITENRTEIAVHVGIAESVFEGGPYQAGGLGPTVDVELGWRHRWLSVIGHGDFTKASSPSDPSKPDDMNARYFGLGCRVRFHFWGAFAGSGIGIESVHLAGPGSATQDEIVPVLEADTGYTFRNIGGVQPQLLGVLQVAPDAGLGIARLSIGLVF